MADTDTSGDTPGPPGSATEGAVATTEEPEASTPELEAGAPSGLALVHHAPEHSHPSPVKYVGIAILLAVITALEVALYYINMPAALFVSFLLVLAILKFTLVVAFFMHLKFDSPMLRRVFIMGIILAGVVYTVALLTLRVLV
jgi:cytochrome c oxidase subunit 4